MDIIQAFTNSLRDADDKHKIFVKREEERFESEKAQIYSRFQKMIDYDKCIDEFVKWWVIMDNITTQYNKYGHCVLLPQKLPIEVITKLKEIKLKHPNIVFDIDGTPKETISQPHHWTVSEDKYSLLALPKELEMFCRFYQIKLDVDEKPHRIIWEN